MLAWSRVLGKRVSVVGLRPCLDECRSALKLWNKNCFGHVGKQIATLQNKLESLECQNKSPMAMEELQNTRDELNKLLDWKKPCGSREVASISSSQGTKTLPFFTQRSRVDSNGILSLE